MEHLQRHYFYLQLQLFILSGRPLSERESEMADSLFITGATGFIGSKLINGVIPTRYEHVYCLSRRNHQKIFVDNQNDRIKFIQGGLFDSDAYFSFLAKSNTVIHLAAATGKANRDEYIRTNTVGTKFLINQCEQAGVKNFLFISTIAVNYLDKSNYYYAQSKEQAENAVKNSRLAYLIVRPTIVIGEKSPLSKTLFKIANAPIIPVFGDGKILIQPIFIDDLVECLLFILRKNNFANEILELGGPEKINFENFFVWIHELSLQKKSKILHIPLNKLKSILSNLEDHFYSYLPINVGQLSAFSNDGTIHENWLYDQFAPRMRNVKEMIRLVISTNQRAAGLSKLVQECKIFTDYLIKKDPNKYIIEKYCEAHAVSKIFNDLSLHPFDLYLLNLSMKNTIYTKLIDAYTSVFKKDALFRKKMVLLIAILENSALSYQSFEGPEKPGIFNFGLKLFIHGIIFVLSLLTAFVLLTPAKIYFSTRPNLSYEGNKLWTKY
jgi:nucleoside-diphosphate-sugar epimerase